MAAAGENSVVRRLCILYKHVDRLSMYGINITEILNAVLNLFVMTYGMTPPSQRTLSSRMAFLGCYIAIRLMHDYNYIHGYMIKIRFQSYKQQVELKAA